MKAIFLEIDNVLNNKSSGAIFCKENVNAFNLLLQEDLYVVLTSHWRKSFPLSFIERHMREAGVVIPVLGAISNCDDTTENLIKRYLSSIRFDKHIVLDSTENKSKYRMSKDRLFLTEPQFGLTQRNLIRIRNVLK